MGKITVWECDTTGDIFKNYDEYIHHRKEQYRIHHRFLRQEAHKNRALEIINPMYDLETIPEIVDFVNKNWRILYQYYLNDFHSNNLPKCVEVSIDGHYTDLVSNTHSCPKNGVENWHREKNLPMGYPGIAGRIYIQYDEPEWGHFSSTGFLSRIGLNTGSGGGSFNRESYELRLYFDDFPGLKNTAIYAKMAGIDITDAVFLGGKNG